MRKAWGEVFLPVSEKRYIRYIPYTAVMVTAWSGRAGHPPASHGFSPPETAHKRSDQRIALWRDP